MYSSDLIPKWLKTVIDPQIQCILITGCGGGFDFAHSLLLIPELFNLQKKVVIVSNSFASSFTYSDYETAYTISGLTVKTMVPFREKPNSGYIPEKVFLDTLCTAYPNAMDHLTLFASDATRATAGNLPKLLQQVVDDFKVDLAITIDGGSDSIMRGDEYDIATVSEDLISLVSINKLTNIKAKMLIILGLGADRFHGASDASSLRAIAELTRLGGFLGSSSISQDSLGFAVYSDFLLRCQPLFPSIVGSVIAASVVGQFGPTVGATPTPIKRDFEKSGCPASAKTLFKLTKDGSNSDSLANPRVSKKTTYIWPIMSQFYAFDVEVVLDRSILKTDAEKVNGYDNAIRIKIEREKKILGIEDFPTTKSMMNPQYQ